MVQFERGSPAAESAFRTGFETNIPRGSREAASYEPCGAARLPLQVDRHPRGDTGASLPVAADTPAQSVFTRDGPGERA